MVKRPIIKRSVPLSEQVSDIISYEIKQGLIAPGGLLPTEAELSTRLEVSRTVVREAIARLKYEGLIETQKGGRSKISRDTSGLVFRLNIKEQNGEDIEKLYEMRAIIEPEAAAMAALRASSQQIQEIKECLRKLKLALSEGGEGSNESLNFHKAILDASGNPHLAKFVTWVDKKIWAFTEKILTYKNGKMLIDVQHEHSEIVKAIEEHNPKKVRKIARRHVIEAAKRHDLKISIP